MPVAVVVHEIRLRLYSLDAIAFGDRNRQWIIFADRLTQEQRTMLRPHVEIALGCPEDGIRGLTIPFGQALAMELTPYVEDDLHAVDGPGDFSDPLHPVARN